jgi:hypothetical protein
MMMMTAVEQSVEWDLAGETEVLGEYLPKCHFVHHKSHMIYLGRRGGKPATNRLSYGTAFHELLTETNSDKHSFSWESHSLSAGQEIFRHLWNWKGY